MTGHLRERWEYALLDLQDSWLDDANEAGDEGWEIVDVMPAGVLMKRQLYPLEWSH